MLIPILLLVLGFALLIAGADFLVRGASSLAKRFNVPEIVIGLTVVAFGTSMPELIVNIFSSIKGASDIAFGNIKGSNNFNILIILGISALIYPLDVKRDTTWKEIPFALLIGILGLILVNDRWFNYNATDVLSRIDGLVFLALFILFLLYTRNLSKKGVIEVSNVKVYTLLLTFGFVAAGFAALIWGGDIVVKQAIIIANQFGVSQKVIALTIVAAGTSLPELATSAVAAYKKHPDIAVGNIVGSNIFNLLFILGISSMIHPPVYKTSFNTDFYLMIFATALLFVFMFIPRRHRLDRWQGALFILVYIAYAVFLLK
jgi:cation:H+ antiporter